LGQSAERRRKCATVPHLVRVPIVVWAVVVQRSQRGSGGCGGQQGRATQLVRSTRRHGAVLLVEEGIVLADVVALPLCQSPLSWRAVGTNLGLL
jgi:hypothetical protein